MEQQSEKWWPVWWDVMRLAARTQSAAARYAVTPDLGALVTELQETAEAMLLVAARLGLKLPED